MKNEYEVRGDFTAIFIKSPKHGKMETLISTSKLERVQEYYGTWHLSFNKYTQSFYVKGQLAKENGKQKTIAIHRWITNAPKDMQVDHINHNTLDNTDINLRVVTQLENSQNKRGASKNSKSGIRGVYWSKNRRKWCSVIRIKNKSIHLGSFTYLEDAESAVKKARAELMPFSLEAM